MKSRRNPGIVFRFFRMDGMSKFLFLALFLFGNVYAFGKTNQPSSDWTWEEITKDFAALRPDSSDRSLKDGALLRKIDPARTLSFLLPFLSKDQPPGIRLNAISAFNGAELPDSAPFIEKVALDSEEDSRVRYSALWPTLSKFDKTRASEVGIACLSDKEKTVRLGAYWLLGHTGGAAAIDALKARFLTSDEKQLALQALGDTKDPEAIKFLVEQSSADDLRKDEAWRRNFARAMAATPIAEAQEKMVGLMHYGDWLVQRDALLYFRTFPSAEAGPCIVAYFEDPRTSRGLKSYADTWFFANATALRAETKESLRDCVRETYPEAVFDKGLTEPAVLDDDTLSAIIGATFGKEPSSLSPDERSCVGSVQRIADDQVLLKQNSGSAVIGFLVVRKDGHWVVAAKKLLRIICL
jgi:hypothetical protein